MNFALILVVLTLSSGFIYLLDVLFFAKRRKDKKDPGKLIEYSRSFFPVFLIVLLLQRFQLYNRNCIKTICFPFPDNSSHVKVLFVDW